jgi:hypothetical protein
MVNVSPDSAALLVKADVACRQMDKEVASTAPAHIPSDTRTESKPDETGTTRTASTVPQRPRRFHGSVTLDPARVGRDAGRIAEEVIAHLAGLVGAEVTVTLEIHAEIPAGAPDNVVHTLTENCRTLKFYDHGFEKE